MEIEPGRHAGEGFARGASEESFPACGFACGIADDVHPLTAGNVDSAFTVELLGDDRQMILTEDFFCPQDGVESPESCVVADDILPGPPGHWSQVQLS